MTTETRTIIPKGESIAHESYFGIFDVPETASTYRVLVYRHPTQAIVGVAILNWETSCEFGSLPTSMGTRFSIAEHLTDGNLVDAENLVAIFQHIEREWPRG